MTNIIPYGRQSISDEDIEAVVDSLKSDFLTQGPRVKQFEDSFADYLGAKYAVAVANGTAALHLCALAMEVKSNHKVITTPITFAASANCIRYCGGEVVFADIDPDTYLLDINKVRELLESSPTGTYNGLIPVDFAGRATNLKNFRELADEFGLWIIEDACHAPGGFFRDDYNNIQNCGNGEFADLAIFSFHPVKHIASGEGGMITTDNEDLYQRLLRLRSHGITRDENLFTNSIGIADERAGNDDWPGWYMEMQELGYNYRLTDIQSALGLSQLSRADEGLKRRKEIAAIYYENFSDKEFILGQSGVVDGHAYHLYVIEVNDRLGLYNHLRSKHIYSQIHYMPVHLMPYYQQFGWKKKDFPNAERYYDNCMSLPMFPTLKEDELEFVINSVMEFYG